MLKLITYLLLLQYPVVEEWLSWNQSDSPGIIGYRIYVNRTPMQDGQPRLRSEYYMVIDLPDTNLGYVPVLGDGGMYYFRVTAFADPDFIIPVPYPDAGHKYQFPESDLSNEVSKIIGASNVGAPTEILSNFHIQQGD